VTAPLGAVFAAVDARVVGAWPRAAGPIRCAILGLYSDSPHNRERGRGAMAHGPRVSAPAGFCATQDS
jgi:hypothetical protein